MTPRLESCQLSNDDQHSLDFTYNRMYMKLFKSSNIDLVKECQSYCRLKAHIVLTFLDSFRNNLISPANRSWSGLKSVHMHRSRADNVHEILGAIV